MGEVTAGTRSDVILQNRLAVAVQNVRELNLGDCMSSEFHFQKQKKKYPYTKKVCVKIFLVACQHTLQHGMNSKAPYVREAIYKGPRAVCSHP